MHRILLALLVLSPIVAAPSSAHPLGERVGATEGRQDETKIKDLIQKLDDDSFEAREQAEKDLVAIGEPAIPFLKKAIEEADQRKDRGELKVRSTSALRSIEFSKRAGKVYWEPKLVTIQAKDVELSQVLDEIGKKTDVKFDLSSVDAREKVNLDIKDAPLFQVLDFLCRSQESLSYEWREETVKLVKERFVAYP